MLMRNIVRITRIGQTGTRFMSVRPRSQVNTTKDNRHVNNINYDSFPRIRNTCVNFLPAGHNYVVERFGEFVGTLKPGLNMLIPFVHTITQVENRELCLRVEPEIATTKDNVMVTMGGNLYVRFTDPVKAVYGASRPIYSVQQLGQSVMRTEVGNFQLDTLFSERSSLNTNIRKYMNEGSPGENGNVKDWGCSVIRFEITDLEPCDEAVSESLHKQSTADRERRETIITAEAHKRKVELEADAYAYEQLITAKGDADKIKLSADAEAYRIKTVAEAQRESIEMVATALTTEEADKVIKYRLSENYIEEFGKIAGESNTMIIPQNMSDLASMIGTGYKVFDGTANQ